jgi:predicted dinucleotide-binding enzyme
MTVIVVLGAGNIGATLARKWTAAGHQVTLASRNPDAPALRDLADGIDARTATHADAVRDAEVVLVALPGDAVAAVAAALGDALDGKVVIDATNNLGAAEMNSIRHHYRARTCCRALPGVQLARLGELRRTRLPRHPCRPAVVRGRGQRRRVGRATHR